MILDFTDKIINEGAKLIDKWEKEGKISNEMFWEYHSMLDRNSINGIFEGITETFDSIENEKVELDLSEYLIINCEPLGDQWECDADRRPRCVVADITKYVSDLKNYENENMFDIYVIKENGETEQLLDYNDIDWSEKPLRVSKSILKILKEKMGK